MRWTNQIHPPYFELPNYDEIRKLPDDHYLEGCVRRSLRAINDSKELLKFVDRVLSRGGALPTLVGKKP